MQPTRNDLTKNQSQRRRAAFSISAPKRDAKPGLEPLRDGDDVNLASESEEFGGANAKDMGAQTKAGARTPGNQKSRPFSRESMQKTTSSGTKEGNQGCILCFIIVLLLMLVATSSLTVVVILHWRGTVKWFPTLNNILYE